MDLMTEEAFNGGPPISSGSQHLNQGPQMPFSSGPRPHPQSTVILVLGILSVIFCQLTGPFAWYMGSKAMKEIEANPGMYSGEGEVRIGQILGIVGTILLVLIPLAFMMFFGFAFLAFFIELAAYTN